MGFQERYQQVLDKCADPRHFGVKALYLSKGAAPGAEPVEILGVPSRELLEVFSGNGLPSKTHRARFGVNLKKLNDSGIDPKEGDTLTIKGVNFTIRDVDADGEGGAAFVLSKKKE